jgi:nucleoside diphosphate kinase
LLIIISVVNQFGSELKALEMEDAVNEQQEQFYEYLTNRPIAFTLLLFFGSILSAVEIASNVLILIIKLRPSSEKKGFDILIANLSVMFIISGLMLIQFMVEESFHEFTNDGLCNTYQFFIRFSMTSVIFSMVALVIVSRFFSNTSVKSALVIIVFIKIASTFGAFPYTPSKATLVEMRNGKTRKMCSVPEDYDDFEIWRTNHLVMITVEFAVPSVLFAVSSIVAILVKSKNAASENRNNLLHSIIIGTCFILVQIPLNVMEALYYYYIDMSYGWFLIFQLIAHLVGFSNIFLYCNFNRTFYKQICQFFMLFMRNDGIELINEDGVEKCEK